MEYEFRFVVEGAAVEDGALVHLLLQEYDAVLFRGGGVDLLDIAFEGDDVFDAAIGAARALSAPVPRLRLLYLHRDLVGIPEIADRAKVTRQNVHQWVTGARRSDTPFPRPEGTAARSQVWLWADVNVWLRQYGQDDGVLRPDRFEMAEIDSALHASLAYRTDISISRWRRTRALGAAAAPGLVEGAWKPALRGLTSRRPDSPAILTVNTPNVAQPLTMFISELSPHRPEVASSTVLADVRASQ